MARSKNPNKVSQKELLTAVCNSLAIAQTRTLAKEEKPHLFLEAKWADQVHGEREAKKTATINKKMAERDQITAERRTAKGFMAKLAEVEKTK